MREHWWLIKRERERESTSGASTKERRKRFGEGNEKRKDEGYSDKVILQMHLYSLPRLPTVEIRKRKRIVTAAQHYEQILIVISMRFGQTFRLGNRSDILWTISRPKDLLIVGLSDFFRRIELLENNRELPFYVI